MAKESSVVVQQIQAAQATTEENAASLTTLLSQALKSGDRELLETALHITDPVVIDTTVSKLPSPQAPLLLAALLERMQTKPNRTPQLLPWLRSCLSCQASSLMCNGAASRPVLLALQGYFEERLACRDELLGLAGRLDLLMMQAVRRTAESEEEAARTAAIINRPVAVYEADDESEDEEADVQLVQAGSESDSEDASDSDSEMSVDSE